MHLCTKLYFFAIRNIVNDIMSSVINKTATIKGKIRLSNNQMIGVELTLKFNGNITDDEIKEILEAGLTIPNKNILISGEIIEQEEQL